MSSGAGSSSRIKSFRIRNFRSIGDESVEIELGRRITILIGLNNSGKSNIIKALEIATSRMNAGRNIRSGSLPMQLQGDVLQEEGSYLDIILDNVNLKHQIDSILSNVISEFYRPSPDVDITDRIPKEKMTTSLQNFFDKVRGDHFVLRRQISRVNEQEQISPANIVIESEEEVRNAWSSVRLNLSMSHQDHRRFLQLLSNSLTIETNSLPPGIPDEYPIPFIALRQLREQQLSLENYRSKIYLLQKDDIDAFKRLEEIITSAFPNYESIVPEHNDEDNTSVVYLKSGAKQWELGIQGDGIKRMLLFFLFLVSGEDTLLMVDEPEMHLHPNLENRIIDFFQQYGKGQLIMATHSEIIVNSVPPELIDSGDVVINWLWLDENNQTRCKRSSKSDVVEHLNNLGVPTDRYLRHMYAHSSKRVFVEGKNDSKYIKMILKKFNLSNELDNNDISFIEYEGKYNLHKIDSFLIDAALKAGGSEIETSPVSCLFLRDKDESVTKLEEASNLMILTVRELENTVISESSVRGVVSEIVSSFEIDDFDFTIFEKEFITCIRSYLNR
ncbi:MAG: ATP-dependent endonuclease [Candidatus Thorarchaeota archaeon]